MEWSGRDLAQSITRLFRGGTEEIYQEPPSGLPILGPRFEPGPPVYEATTTFGGIEVNADGI